MIADPNAGVMLLVAAPARNVGRGRVRSQECAAQEASNDAE
jgi:hypothetical protein